MSRSPYVFASRSLQLQTYSMRSVFFPPISIALVTTYSFVADARYLIDSLSFLWENGSDPTAGHITHSFEQTVYSIPLITRIARMDLQYLTLCWYLAQH